MRYATEADRSDKGVVHTYQIDYPSGQRWSLTGVYFSVALPGMSVAPAVRVNEKMVVLDPRAVVSREGLIIAEPRISKTHAAWVQEWLDAHPEWPRIVTEEP